MIKAVCIDLINTLVSEKKFVLSRADDVDLSLLESIGIRVDKKNLINAKIKALNEMRALPVYERSSVTKFYKILINKLGINNVDNEQIEKIARVYENEYLSGLEMNEEWYMVLEKLKKNGKRIMVVSNSRKEFINKVYRKFSIEKYIDYTFSCSDNKIEKSSGRPYIFLQKRFMINKNEMVAVGDKLDSDCVGAIKSGVVFIKYGSYDDNLEKRSNCSHFFLAKRPADIIEIIEILDNADS